MPQQSFDYSNYGQAGGELQSRFEVTNDPRAAIILNADGQMYSTISGHKIGLKGSAYRYGPTVVGGVKNLLPRDGFVISLPTNTSQTLFTDYRDFAATVGQYNVGAGETFKFFLNGLMSSGGVEVFTSAGTATLTGSTVTGAGTAFTTATVPGYGYIPSLATPQPGDFIQIPATTGKEYIITKVTDATHLEVYNPGGNVASSAYLLKRYGFPSASRVIWVETLQMYYSVLLANGHNNPVDSGTIGAFSEVGVHYTAPQNVANLDIMATDIAFYKSFLIYGYGSAISWSIAGFPSTSPFGALDFPATNTSVIAPDDTFVSFEYLGDQLVALFQNSLWLVVPTGTIPEFNFYKLPENRGANVSIGTTIIGGAGFVNVPARVSCSAPGAAYYMNQAGAIEFAGSIGRIISGPISDIYSNYYALSPGSIAWDPNLDAILLSRSDGKCLLYERPTGFWSFIDYSGLGTNVGVWRWPPSSRVTGAYSLFYLSADGTHYFYPPGPAIDLDSAPTTDAIAWSWSSPIVNVSDVYSKYQFRGIAIDAHGDYSTTPSLTWQIYAGTSPYNMLLESSGTYGYKSATVSSRDLVGKKIDKPFIGVVLSGSKYIKLNSVLVYDTRTDARR